MQIYSEHNLPIPILIKLSKENGINHFSILICESLSRFFSHVIVCGHITHHSLSPFLRDFLHKGRNEADHIDVLIIDRFLFNTFLKLFQTIDLLQRQTPDIELEALLKRYYTKLQYFIGSVMNIADLQRIQV